MSFSNADAPLEIMEVKPGLQQEFENVMELVQALGLGLSVLITFYIGLREARARHAEAAKQALEEAKKRQAEHRLALVQQQIGVLFGPLKGLIEATRAAMLSARKSLKQKRLVPREALFLDEECTQPNKTFSWFSYNDAGEPIDQDVNIVIEWRRWVRTVISPCQEDMFRLIRDNTCVQPVSPEDCGTRDRCGPSPRHALSILLCHSLLTQRPWG